MGKQKIDKTTLGGSQKYFKYNRPKNWYLKFQLTWCYLINSPTTTLEDLELRQFLKQNIDVRTKWQKSVLIQKLWEKSVYMCVCTCVCLRERERERESYFLYLYVSVCIYLYIAWS